MPPAKSTPSGGGSAVKPGEWKMPVAPHTIVWRNAPGGESFYGLTTKYNRNSISVALFVPESRVVVPKDGVRHIDDPWNKVNGINPDSGVWEHTAETAMLLELAAKLELKSA